MLGDLLDFAGSLISGSRQKKQYSQSMAFEREKFAEGKKQFASQMDQSIQRRVADASKAGIHPLFALGGSAGAAPTISAGSAPAPTGSAVGDSISRIGARMAAAQIAKDEAAAEHSHEEAMLTSSYNKKMQLELDSRGRDGVTTYPYGTQPAGEVAYGPAEFYNPEVPVSQRPGVRAGQIPGTVEIRMPDGHVFRTFADELQADEIKQVDIVAQRAHFKGENLWEKMYEWFDRTAKDHVKQQLIRDAKKARGTGSQSAMQFLQRYLRR